MKEKICIHWFRRDLRLNDNPSINFLSQFNYPILFIYINDENHKKRRIGSASRVWLHHSIKYLNVQLSGKLNLFSDKALDIFKKLIQEFDIQAVSWNRCYESEEIKRDSLIKDFLKKSISNVKSFNGSLLWEPWEVLKNDGTPYKVFTPFYKRGCLLSSPPRKPLTEKINRISDRKSECPIDSLKLLPDKNWKSKPESYWKIGEEFAEEILDNFMLKGINGYQEGRNYPSKNNVSKLSPYIHWGQISPNTIWYNVDKNKAKDLSLEDVDVFKSELGWREFSYYLLYHFPQITEKNLQSKFNNFKWENNPEYLEKWSSGRTGYPIIDAGMRELWKTGYMHNRVRMIVGSFLVKNLLNHWKNGESWFWDCLFDADSASNSASWQWVAGTGADAAPYFRIFNPVTQGQRFDPNGDYVKEYIPEIKNLPIKFLHCPWEIPEELSQKVNFKLGIDYPFPIVNIKESREKALDIFALLKKDK